MVLCLMLHIKDPRLFLMYVSTYIFEQQIFKKINFINYDLFSLVLYVL